MPLPSGFCAESEVAPGLKIDVLELVLLYNLDILTFLQCHRVFGPA